MDKMLFKAYAVTNEIDLNKIAVQCNIPKKYTWEEPLILQGDVLTSILGHEVSEDQKILVFSFGSIVLINSPTSDTQPFMEYIKKFKPDIDCKEWEKYTDDYELHVDDKKELNLNDQYVIVPKLEMYHPELISIVIAKSVALEKTEEQLGKILDNIENNIDNLEKGKMNIRNRDLAKTISSIVRHEYNTIAYIMILDKPDITWTSTDAEEFYDNMTGFFELSDRYEIIKKKTDILNNIIDGFSSISYSTRTLFVEWVIVILILVEIVLMVGEFLK